MAGKFNFAPLKLKGVERPPSERFVWYDGMSSHVLKTSSFAKTIARKLSQNNKHTLKGFSRATTAEVNLDLQGFGDEPTKFDARVLRGRTERPIGTPQLSRSIDTFRGRQRRVGRGRGNRRGRGRRGGSTRGRGGSTRGRGGRGGGTGDGRGGLGGGKPVVTELQEFQSQF